MRPLRLTDLDPQWYAQRGRTGQGVDFQCPVCFDRGPRFSGDRIRSPFSNPIDGGAMLPPLEGQPGGAHWRRVGTDFATLTLDPSIRYDGTHWHGFVENGIMLNELRSPILVSEMVSRALAERQQQETRMSDDTTLPPPEVPAATLAVDLTTPPAPSVAHPTDPVPAVVPPLPVPPAPPTHGSLFKEFIEKIQERAEKIKDLVENKIGTEAERAAVIEEVLALVKGLAPLVTMIHPDAGSMINNVVVLLTQLDNLNKRTAA